MSKQPRSPRTTNVDTTPVLGLVAILIPMLLMAYAPQVLAVIDSDAPRICASCGDGSHSEVVTPVVRLHAGGLTMESVRVLDGPEEGSLGRFDLACEGRCRSVDAYDWDRMQDVLAETAATTEGTGSVSLVAADDVPYEVVVRAMDMCRARSLDNGDEQVLYPHPTLGASM